jgi:hypothetical protein
MNWNPRTVRNFWIEGKIDGRKPKLPAGPSKKDGGFDLTIYIRKEGDVHEAVTILGRAAPDGDLALRIQRRGEEDLIVRSHR